MENIPLRTLRTLPGLIDAITTTLSALKQDIAATISDLSEDDREAAEASFQERQRQPRQVADFVARLHELCTDRPPVDTCIHCPGCTATPRRRHQHDYACNNPPVYLGRCAQHQPIGGVHYCNSCFLETRRHSVRPVNATQASLAGFTRATQS